MTCAEQERTDVSTVTAGPEGGGVGQPVAPEKLSYLKKNMHFGSLSTAHIIILT